METGDSWVEWAWEVCGTKPLMFMCEGLEVVELDAEVFFWVLGRLLLSIGLCWLSSN